MCLTLNKWIWNIFKSSSEPNSVFPVHLMACLWDEKNWDCSSRIAPHVDKLIQDWKRPSLMCFFWIQECIRCSKTIHMESYLQCCSALRKYSTLIWNNVKCRNTLTLLLNTNEKNPRLSKGKPNPKIPDPLKSQFFATVMSLFVLVLTVFLLQSYVELARQMPKYS